MGSAQGVEVVVNPVSDDIVATEFRRRNEAREESRAEEDREKVRVYSHDAVRFGWIECKCGKSQERACGVCSRNQDDARPDIKT